jgi:hypothetical protein
MKVKLIDAIQMSIGERVPARLPMTSINFALESDEPLLELSDQVKHIARVEVLFSQIAPVKDAPRMKHTAIRAIAHHIYQDVEAEIHLALRELWEEGLHHSAAAKRLEAMLPVLRGEQNKGRT